MLFDLLNNTSHLLLGWGCLSQADTRGARALAEISKVAHTVTPTHAVLAEYLPVCTWQVDTSGLLFCKNRIAAALSTMPTLCLVNECALGRGHSFKMQPERKKNVMHQPTLLGNREQWGIICTATGLHFSTLLPPSFLTQWHPSHPQSCGCTEDPQTWSSVP